MLNSLSRACNIKKTISSNQAKVSWNINKGKYSTHTPQKFNILSYQRHKGIQQAFVNYSLYFSFLFRLFNAYTLPCLYSESYIISCLNLKSIVINSTTALSQKSQSVCYTLYKYKFDLCMNEHRPHYLSYYHPHTYTSDMTKKSIQMYNYICSILDILHLIWFDYKEKGQDKKKREAM